MNHKILSACLISLSSLSLSAQGMDDSLWSSILFSGTSLPLTPSSEAAAVPTPEEMTDFFLNAILFSGTSLPLTPSDDIVAAPTPAKNLLFRNFKVTQSKKQKTQLFLGFGATRWDNPMPAHDLLILLQRAAYKAEIVKASRVRYDDEDPDGDDIVSAPAPIPASKPSQTTKKRGRADTPKDDDVGAPAPIPEATVAPKKAERRRREADETPKKVHFSNTRTVISPGGRKTTEDAPTPVVAPIASPTSTVPTSEEDSNYYNPEGVLDTSAYDFP